MQTRRYISRLAIASFTLAAASAVVAISGCGTMAPASNMVAFTTQLRGANEVPANASMGSGSVDAALNKDTMKLSWKVNYSGMTGNATAGHFHGPAAVAVEETAKVNPPAPFSRNARSAGWAAGHASEPGSGGA